MNIVKHFISSLICIFYMKSSCRGVSLEVMEIDVAKGDNFSLNLELLCALNGSRLLRFYKENKEVGICNGLGLCKNNLSESKGYFFKTHNATTIMMNISHVVCGDSGNYSYAISDVGTIVCNGAIAILTVTERMPPCMTELLNVTSDTCLLYKWARQKQDRAKIVIQKNANTGNEENILQQSSHQQRSAIMLNEVFLDMEVPDLCFVFEVIFGNQLSISTSMEPEIRKEHIVNEVASFQCCHMNESVQGSWLYDDFWGLFPLMYVGQSFIVLLAKMHHYLFPEHLHAVRSTI